MELDRVNIYGDPLLMKILMKRLMEIGLFTYAKEEGYFKHFDNELSFLYIKRKFRWIYLDVYSKYNSKVYRMTGINVESIDTLEKVIELVNFSFSKDYNPERFLLFLGKISDKYYDP